LPKCEISGLRLTRRASRRALRASCDRYAKQGPIPDRGAAERGGANAGPQLATPPDPAQFQAGVAAQAFPDNNGAGISRPSCVPARELPLRIAKRLSAIWSFARS
jgi:hypothetical protein